MSACGHFADRFKLTRNKVLPSGHLALSRLRPFLSRAKFPDLVMFLAVASVNPKNPGGARASVTEEEYLVSLKARRFAEMTNRKRFSWRVRDAGATVASGDIF